MSLSVVIATSALQNNSQLSSGGVPYARRAWLLRNVILPCYTAWAKDLFTEIVVVGEFESGEGYRYLPFDSVYHDCADALLKRQAGFDSLTQEVEWVLFQHDDHLYDPTNPYPDSRTAVDVLSPSRWTRGRGTLELLNNGAQSGYLNGHACLMRPSVFRRGFKWSDIPPVFTWDIGATKRLEHLGIPWGQAPQLRVLDMEEGAQPWD